MATLIHDSSRRRRQWMALAATVSLALHGLAAWGVHDIPLGHIDPRLLADDRVARVRLVDAGPLIEPRLDRADAANPAPETDLDPAALSAAILESLPAPALARAVDAPAAPGDGSAHAPREPDLDIRTLPTVAEGSGDAPDGALSIATRPPQSEPDPRVTTTTPATTAGAAADAAMAMLDAMSVNGSATPVPRAQAPLRPEHTPRTTADLALPDYAEAALASTTRFDVPEHLDNDFDYRLTVYQAPRGPDFFRVDIKGRRSLSRLRTMAKDVVFLVDTSGSIAQAWVDGVSRGIRDSLSSLNQGDRFNIVLFDERPRFFSPRRIRAVDETALAEARAFLEGAQSQGYTDVNEALSRLLVRDVEDDRVYTLVLISDGKPTRGVMDTRELINRITRDNDLNAGIYCIGIGSGQNRTLLDFLAYRNRGYSLFVKQSAKTAGTIRDLVSRIRYPILKQVDLDAVGVTGSDVVPQALPDIHQGQHTVVFGRFDRRTMRDLTIRVQGSNHGGAYDFTFRRSLAGAEAGTAQIARDWAFQMLHHLYGEMLDAQDPGRVKKEIEALRRRYRLKTVY